jgi:hypothetical protein
MDYIELGGRRLRVEVNWNAYEAFLDLMGKGSFDDLSALLMDFSPKTVKRLMTACINEGERMDGKPGYTPEEIGEMISRNGAEINDFMVIYTRQSTPATPAEDSKKK